jgi:hypothetical protein
MILFGSKIYIFHPKKSVRINWKKTNVFPKKNLPLLRNQKLRKKKKIKKKKKKKKTLI